MGNTVGNPPDSKTLAAKVISKGACWTYAESQFDHNEVIRSRALELKSALSEPALKHRKYLSNDHVQPFTLSKSRDSVKSDIVTGRKQRHDPLVVDQLVRSGLATQQEAIQASELTIEYWNIIEVHRTLEHIQTQNHSVDDPSRNSVNNTTLLQIIDDIHSDTEATETGTISPITPETPSKKEIESLRVLSGGRHMLKIQESNEIGTITGRNPLETPNTPGVGNTYLHPSASFHLSRMITPPQYSDDEETTNGTTPRRKVKEIKKETRASITSTLVAIGLPKHYEMQNKQNKELNKNDALYAVSVQNPQLPPAASHHMLYWKDTEQKAEYTVCCVGNDVRHIDYPSGLVGLVDSVCLVAYNCVYIVFLYIMNMYNDYNL